MKKSCSWLIILFLGVCLLSINLVFAKIPEPSNIIYGTIHIGGVQMGSSDTGITVVARLASTTVSTYQMGENEAYGDQYLLKIPLDSVGTRNANSTQKNDVINIFVSNILAETITIGERGTLQENNLVVDATDTDGDGMPDYWEIQYGLSINVNDANQDKDGDGLTNLAEYIFGSNPTVADSDGDGMIDLFEHTNGFNPNDPADGGLDADSDGLTNFEESQNGTNPHSDDSDGDGMSDAFEVQYSLNPNDASDAGLDNDGDGYTNLEEYQNGTDPSTDEGSSQSQMNMIAQVNAFSGDISGMDSDETLTFVSSHNSDQVKILNNQSGELEETISTGSKNGINAIKRLHSLLFIATGDNQVVVWDYILNKKEAELTDSNSSLLSLDVDENHLIAGAADGKIYVWTNNSNTFEFETSWKASEGFITSVGLTEDKIFSFSLMPQRVVRIWERYGSNLKLYEVTANLPCCELPTLSYNQSNLILSGTNSEKMMTSVSISTLESKNLSSQDTNVSIVEATSSHFISADRNGNIYIWNQNSGTLLRRFKAHDDSIRSIKIRGQYLITGSVNGEVKIWDYPY